MFEGLIEQLILAYLGDYIENLDRDKLSLGIWSGSLTLENIQINSKAISDLKLPFILSLGRIDKLTLCIAWKSNFSSPTEITIEGINIVLSLLSPNYWEVLDYTSYESKIQMLMKHCQEKYLKLVESFNEVDTNKQKGYTERVLLKIIDNIHLTINNINIRIEEYNNNPYSIGITMKEMLVINTNQNWERHFIDRNIEKNATIYKLLQISKFGLYLKVNEEENNFISKIKDIEERYINMKKLIESENEEELKKKTCYLIEPLDISLKMKQLNDTIENKNNEEAKISLFIHLPNFKTQILKEQYDCIFLILNHITKYQKFQKEFYQMRKFNYFKPKYKIRDKENKENKLTDPKIKNENAILWFQFAIQMVLKQIKYYKGDKTIFQIPKEVLESYKEKFMNLFTIYYKGIKKNSNFILDNKNDKELFEHIIYVVDISILYNWCNNVIEKVFKEEKIEEKKYAQSSYFSYWFGTSNIDEKKLFSDEEQKKLSELMNNELDLNQEGNKQQNNLQIEFILDEGGIVCSQNEKSSKVSIIEGFEIKYEKIHFLFKMNSSLQKYSIESTLNDFIIDLFTVVNKNKRKIPLTFKDINNKDVKLGNSEIDTDSIIDYKNDNNIPYFISLKFKYSPLEDINSFLFCHLTQLNILYHQVFLQRVIEFFTIKYINELMVNNAYDKYKNLSIQTREAINQNISKKNIFQINIDPRCIIIPLNKYDFSNSKVLILDFGNIKMDNSLNSNEKVFDEKYPKKYYFSLDSLTIDFYKSMKEMKKRINKIEVLKDVSWQIGISILNKKLYSIKENPPMKLQISIDNITLQLTEYIYTILIQLSNILKPVKEKDLWNQLITDKKDIAKNAKVTALILKKNYFGSYENFLAMVSGGYIYFYHSGQDEEYAGYYYLKDTILNPNKDNLSIELENYSGTIEIKFRNETKFKSWEKCLRERIEEMTTSNEGRDEILDAKFNKQNITPIDKENLTFGVECIFKSVNLALIHESNDNKFEDMFKITINSLLLGILIRSEDIEVNLSIDGVKIFDLQEKINEFQQIISSEDEKDKETKLLNLNILLPSEKSPKYKGNQIEVILNFGYLYVIWNPISFRKLLFFLIYNDDLNKKVISEISDPNEQLIEQKFIEPSKEKKNYFQNVMNINMFI